MFPNLFLVLQSEKMVLVDWDRDSLGGSYCFGYTDLSKGEQIIKFCQQD